MHPVKPSWKKLSKVAKSRESCHKCCGTLGGGSCSLSGCVVLTLELFLNLEHVFFFAEQSEIFTICQRSSNCQTENSCKRLWFYIVPFFSSWENIQKTWPWSSLDVLNDILENSTWPPPSTKCPSIQQTNSQPLGFDLGKWHSFSFPAAFNATVRLPLDCTWMVR